MSLKLANEQLQAICNHAESIYPEECCGLLLGKMDQADKTLVEVVVTDNAWNREAVDTFAAVDDMADLDGSKRSHYTITPEVMLRVQRQARDRQLDIIGIYHSHPDHPAIPSEFDRVYAWQQYSYLIVSVQQGKASDWHSWSLDDYHQFQPEEVIVIESQIPNLF